MHTDPSYNREAKIVLDGMPFDFRNINLLWASVLVETLHRLGLSTAVICPGSRSSPLAIAFAQHGAITAIPVLDERSAAFFALGIAKRTDRPVVLVCTSGTAGANFYPAVIEAKESRVPLLLLTVDRPPELRHCHAGQTIDQLKLYGNYPNWQAEITVPEAKREQLQYLRQTLIQAWERTRFPSPGPVHLNQPLREPLAPLPDGDLTPLAAELNFDTFFTALVHQPQPRATISSTVSRELLHTWQTADHGIIIGGLEQGAYPEAYCQAIARLSKTLNWPVFAEALSPLRNYADLNPNLIATYDAILREPTLAKRFAPEQVIQIGELPTSKELRTWLSAHQPQRWLIDPSSDNFDPLHGPTIHLRTTITVLASQWSLEKAHQSNLSVTVTEYLSAWQLLDSKVRQTITHTMARTEHLLESKVAWLLSQTLPPGTPLFIANSMPVRDAEFFWMPGDHRVRTYFNRGANGIDGTLSTALGIAFNGQSSVLLTGDLAFLHDSNGLLIAPKVTGHLTVIVINNDGGGIFEMLPIATFEPPFEDFFATPQQVDVAQLCAAHGVEYQQIPTWEQLEKLLNPLPKQGLRVLEVKCDRKRDAQWRINYCLQLAQSLLA